MKRLFVSIIIVSSVHAMEVKLSDPSCSLEATKELGNLFRGSNVNACAESEIAQLVKKKHADPNACVFVMYTVVASILELAITRKADCSHLLVPLIKNGANVNAVSSLNGTALHTAARFLNIDAVRILLQHGADVNAMDRDRRTPLIAAIQTSYSSKDKKEVVELLLQSGASTNISGGPENEVPLMLAAYCDPTLMPLLIAYGANIKDPALLQSANTWLKKQKLLEHGANPYALYPGSMKSSFRQEAWLNSSCEGLYREWNKKWAPMRKVFSEFKYRAGKGMLQCAVADEEGRIITHELLPPLPLEIIGNIWGQVVPWTLDNQCDLEKEKWLMKEIRAIWCKKAPCGGFEESLKEFCKKETFPGKHILGTSANRWVHWHTGVDVEELEGAFNAGVIK